MARTIFCSSSKIQIPLTQLFLCVSLMAFLFYCFIYVRPWQDNHVDIITIDSTKVITINTAILDDDTKGNNDTIALVESPKRSINDTIVLIESPKRNNNNNNNNNNNSIILIESPKGNTNDSTNNNIVLVDDDDLSNPPRRVTVHERIEWFKPRIVKSKILKSTAKTRKSHSKIMKFLSQGNDNSTTSTCKVLFFMTWISPKKLFGVRDLLALESIFKSHPQGCAIILSKRMNSKAGRKMLKPLVSEGYRVLVVPPDFHALFSNTPAQGWLERLEAGLIDPGTIPITQNLSNLLRLVALYKYGGVYIDTDIIILKDVSSLRNAVGIQSMEDFAKKQWTPILNNAVLIFDKGHPTLLKFIEEFAYTFNGNRWGYNGPALVTRVVYKQNRDQNLEVNVLPTMAFYPVGWFEIVPYFKSIGENGTKWAQEQMNQLNSDLYGREWYQIIPFFNSVGENGPKWVQQQLYQLHSYTFGIHLWNTGSRRIRIEEGSILGRLISDHCIICKDIYTTPNFTKT